MTWWTRKPPTWVWWSLVALFALRISYWARELLTALIGFTLAFIVIVLAFVLVEGGSLAYRSARRAWVHRLTSR